jgi:pre-mRNA-splicing factor SPF27
VLKCQKSASLTELLNNYGSNPIRGIDASKYAPPNVQDGASVDELVAAERQGRIGEGHMDVR